uniref:GDP-mannose 4,6-dehydratase n=1 Tax=Algoriphagus sp. TaxID=1872435 RepID=UPI004048631F
MKTALICGISGQDGAYLAELLLKKNYTVFGTSRDIEIANWNSLRTLGIYDKVNLISMSPVDFRSVLEVFNKSQPDEVYYLAGQSSVALSFEQPVETIQSIVLGTLNMLEACKLSVKNIKLYNAGSSECFGDIDEKLADEQTRFHPQSPYAVGKSTAYWLVANYRDSYNLFACTGILFNHESPLRPSRFVTQKIVKAAYRIANGSDEKLILGRLDIIRDWGWAPEYVEAMWLMLQQDKPEDLVIATGQSYSLEHFVDEVFKYYNLNWKDFVIQDKKYFRPSELKISKANPSLALKNINWKAKKDLKEIAVLMCQSIELKN